MTSPIPAAGTFWTIRATQRLDQATAERLGEHVWGKAGGTAARDLGPCFDIYSRSAITPQRRSVSSARTAPSACIAGAAMYASAMRTAVVTVDITPPVGGLLLGPMAPSTGVHDPLLAKALVLEEAGRRVVLVALDLIGLAAELSAAMRAAVAWRCAVPDDHVVLLCSHTHSAPFTIPWSTFGWESFCRHEMAWFQEATARVAECAGAAMAGCVPSRLSYARVASQIGMNRRLYGETPGSQAQMQPNPQGHVVSWSDVLRFDTADRVPRAVLFSQAAHPVTVHRTSTLIGADYPGAACRRIQERFGAATIPLFAMACGADNNAPLAVGLAGCERLGQQLGDEVVTACGHALPVTTAGLHFAARCIQIPLRPPASATALAQEVACLEAGSASTRSLEAADRLANLTDSLQRLRAGTHARTMAMEIAVLAFGRDLAVVMLSHEVFSQYQTALDRASPFPHTVVWAYCNRCENYLPTAAEIGRGGYEIEAGPLAYRHRSGPAPEAEAAVLNEALAMLRTAWSREPAAVAQAGAAGKSPASASMGSAPSVTAQGAMALPHAGTQSGIE